MFLTPQHLNFLLFIHILNLRFSLYSDLPRTFVVPGNSDLVSVDLSFTKLGLQVIVTLHFIVINCFKLPNKRTNVAQLV